MSKKIYDIIQEVLTEKIDWNNIPRRFMLDNDIKKEAAILVALNVVAKFNDIPVSALIKDYEDQESDSWRLR